MLDSFYLQYLFGGFVSLIVITNPLSKIPLFISLTQGMSLDVRKKQANWSCYYAAAIMLVSLAAGNLLLVFFGISYGALRISGGFVVGIIGYQMLFGSRDQGGAPVVRRDKDDYSFFPIAMPGISGPGTIAVVIGIASEIAELPNVMDMAGAFFMTGVAIVLTLRRHLDRSAFGRLHLRPFRTVGHCCTDQTDGLPAYLYRRAVHRLRHQNLHCRFLKLIPSKKPAISPAFCFGVQTRRLFRRHALSQVSRFIHVRSFCDGCVISQQLERNDMKNRRKNGVIFRKLNNMHTLGRLDVASLV